ncbi:glutamate--cysteine ligase [Bordetella bronchiseptica]|uniref:Glutamate--cysteine ligase n=3 Tax=Bordetella bronchiseptica TaxID=518 RepID=GSH1_BORBR|nr:glutamate--cysteine ligase [Bordetella bronchiseptica]Q7WES2.1 RecName: Full=Glutamate--cysteine ligase; AltName: Full=Gamma-ECS; Short=GCS; AltName: Full=Gamma-glutamylcysteine synthetase [Bordetella bronchiseptica RB50]SHP61783.1 Glutamate--cysteine ligase [Mycobacteroides abscessus subsp. abscessus]AMG90516.1 glutamate--cysteine ligase [Bordetella bronchiseptica]AWP77046.1 glutamate--cysteine ligase [Bordetella bronchiseptica]AWP81899.1 glutamate--cysteine ligase [Bordetella bronchisepti
MTDTAAQRHHRLQAHADLLTQTLRGIEKEGLRVDHQGVLARTAHPAGLGAALTNAHVTTDYSEALLELITGTHTDVDSLLGELRDTHRYVYGVLEGEYIWNQSMPATLPPEADIPIAWYGTSNTGMLKHVYRRGLAERYGKTMQCIAGVHYNFSLPDALWDVLVPDAPTPQARRSRGYISLIRNFTRYSWLLMYLFGSAPALAREFMRGRDHLLETLDPSTLYLPYATSLRMSDLGYQNKAQSRLKLCYNDLDTFLGRLYEAVTEPWPAYQAIGTRRDGQWIQLNTNVLQIENEYYSSIRPKRATGRCERPITALAERGVQYVEVRCLDIDPLTPEGISAETARFVDAFLLFCATSDSPFFPDNGYCQRSADNFAVVVKEGRKPGLMLDREGQAVSVPQWGHELLDQIAPYAALYDQALGGDAYAAALAAQRAKLDQPDLTPSARVLAALREGNVSFHDYSLDLSRRHADALRAQPLPAERTQAYAEAARQSVAEQLRLEQSDAVDFDTYVAHYHAALKNPLPSTAS